MNDLDEICIWKLTANDPNSTTFQDVKEGHKLYKCMVGDGKKYCCPDYVSYQSIREKEDNDRR